MNFLVVLLTAFSFFLLPIKSSATLKELAFAGKKEPTVDEFSKIIRIVQESGFSDLLEESRKKLKVASILDLRRITNVCSSFDKDPNAIEVVGHIVNTQHFILASRKFEQKTLALNDEQDQSLKQEMNNPNVLNSVVFQKPGYFLIIIEKAPVICLKSNLTLGRAALSLIHELTHWTGYNLNDPLDTFQMPTPNEFLDDLLMRKGGEIDAIMNEALAAKRLLAKFPDAVDLGKDLPSPAATREEAKAKIEPMYAELSTDFFAETLANKVNFLVEIYNFSLELDPFLRGDAARRTPSEKATEAKKYYEEFLIHKAEISNRIDIIRKDYSDYIQ